MDKTATGLVWKEGGEIPPQNIQSGIELKPSAVRDLSSVVGESPYRAKSFGFSSRHGRKVLSSWCYFVPWTGSSPQEKDLRRHSSVSDVPLDSNVLRKVASLTLDKATLEQRIVKPRFVPEKLDFQIYEKFEAV
uniref:Uncharacterized protein n=1 Tax=Timema shepardi TaxID=629360 RepID=A0A7R9FWF8_TIMSH|nr:unnamed protein product [Timema shepardi]